MKRSPRARAGQVADLLHKGFVLSCVGLTLAGTAYLSFRLMHYITVSRPQFIEEKKLADSHLLAEGSSENLRDSAPIIA